MGATTMTFRRSISTLAFVQRQQVAHFLVHYPKKQSARIAVVAMSDEATASWRDSPCMMQAACFKTSTYHYIID